MRLQAKIDRQIRATYAKLTSWQRVQVARHAERPHAQRYIDRLITDYTPLAGDRAFADDAAIVGGLGRLQGRSVVVLGQEKGDDTDSRLKHNFGMARPEGYRKAQRLMQLADRFKLPVLTLVDTPGAYPGMDAEARGQAEAIARSIDTCLEIGVHTFDASVAGLGGCPYAKGATGNVATEDVVFMLDGLGIETGIHLDALVDAGAFISEQLGRPPVSRVGRALLAAYWRKYWVLVPLWMGRYIRRGLAAGTSVVIRITPAD